MIEFISVSVFVFAIIFGAGFVCGAAWVRYFQLDKIINDLKEMRDRLKRAGFPPLT